MLPALATWPVALRGYSLTAHKSSVSDMCQLALLHNDTCPAAAAHVSNSIWAFTSAMGPSLQVYAAVDDIRSGTRMVVFDIHIGEKQASWERQKLVPESIDDACALRSSGRADGALSRSGKAAASWQV